MPVVGFLNGGSPDLLANLVRAFRQGLHETGHIEGQNIAIEYRWAEGKYDRLPALLADLISRQVAVIAATGGDPVALAAKTATARMPIVFNSGTDPVQLGLVASFNRPGGNVTGVSVLSSMLVTKQLELLREPIPTATAISFLVNPNNPSTEERTREMQEAVRLGGQRLHLVTAGAEAEFESAFEAIQQRGGPLVVPGDTLFTNQRDRLVALAARHALPAIYPFREYTLAGGLMSYGPSLADAYRLVGIYTGRILQGAKPADLPVQQATKVELVLNLKTAKSLGLTFPITYLAGPTR